MDKKEAFKDFLRKYPQITEYLKNNKDSSIQKLYEIYDIYGEDKSAWSPYLTGNKTSLEGNYSAGIKDLVKNIDIDSLQEHIKTAQKALGFIEELTTKGASNVNNIPKGPKSPRPLDKFFGD